VTVDIDALQTRLEKHFEAVWTARTAQRLPIFALEHGLTGEELERLRTQLKARLTAGDLRLSKHWLAWVVFATEQGYDYDGDEYWHTFGRRMPPWDNALRPRIRAYFGKFHEKYGGVRPLGRWANFFSIIAWPITHALLPKDLQSQLARTLYGLRYNLVSRLDLPVDELGRYIARMSHGGSSRYENFLEQEALVGSIVRALLGQPIQNGVGAILPSTLDRIVGDLEKARNARQWLQDTRDAVEVARLKGTTRRIGDGTVAQREIRLLARNPTIRPSLQLRRTGPEEWTPILEIPSFREVASLTPELGGFLRTTRCAVAGSPGWRPPGWLLTGAQRRVLDAWPEAGKPAVTFQAANLAMDQLLSGEGHIKSGPTWLFRVCSDGQAVELLGRLVRPGQSYILVSRAEAPTLSMGRATTIRCLGVTALRFDVPTTLLEAQIAELKKADLSVAETIRVWPVGLAARGWDGEGATEWLENESPCFAIEHDHPVDAYELSLSGGALMYVSAKLPGVPTFVRLQPLQAGNHVLSISVARKPSEGAIKPVEGTISLTVRPPRPWVSGTIGHNGLIVACEPPEPTLDEFWEGLTRLDVMGPSGRQVTVCVELMDGAGGHLGREQVAQLTMPLSEDSWRNAFSAFARMEKQPWNYLGASSGRIVVDAEELGVAHIPLQRDVAPVRWVWHNTTRSTQLRLVDDHDSEMPLEVTLFPFGRPVKPTIISAADAIKGIEPPAPGGLFIAKYGEHSEALVVSARRVDGGLGGLLVEPEFEEIRGEREEALALVKAIRAWSKARLIGTLAGQRRDSITVRLKERLYDVMLGPDWARAETNLRVGKLPLDAAVDGFLRCFRDKRTFGVILARDARKYAHMAVSAREREFASLAHRYSIAPGAVTKPAIDLGEVISGRLHLPDEELSAIVEHLWERRALNAGARLIQLLGHSTTPFRLRGDSTGMA
jgi:hypothetical protein